VPKWFEHVKIVLMSMGLSALAIAGLLAVMFAIPVLIGLTITLVIYFILRVLMEDVDT